MAIAFVALAAGAAGACEQELPTDVGGGLLPETALRTFELTLDASDFLVADTVLGGFGTFDRTGVLTVANDFDGMVDSHALLRFASYPSVVSYTTDSTTLVTDSMPTFVSGNVQIRIDTASLGLDTLGTDTTITLQLYTTAEAWDARTASWTARSATGTDTSYWSTPGGTTGALLGTATWTRSDTLAGDTLAFELDSATVAQWGSDDPARGVLVSTPDAGARVQLRDARLRLKVRPSIDPDTLVTASTGLSASTFIYTPEQPAPTALRVGGRPAYRTYLTFVDSLFDRRFACPDAPTTCSFSLGDAAINRAELVLQPIPVAAPFTPLDTIAIEARGVLGPDGLPLARAPLNDTTGAAFAIAPAFFQDPDVAPIHVGVSSFVRALASRPDVAPEIVSRILALLSISEPLRFGYAEFADAPKLRLIVTIRPEVEE